MAKAEDVMRIKRLAEDAARDVSRARGALDQALATLRNEFMCETLPEAEAELAKMEAATTEAERKLDKAIAKFDKDYAGYLE